MTRSSGPAANDETATETYRQVKSETEDTARRGADARAALNLAHRGLLVFPLPARSKHPECKWGQVSTTDTRTVERWFRGRVRNVGVDTGKSGLVVLDEDAAGELDRLCRDQDEALPATFTVTTGKGTHRYYTQPPDVVLTNSPGRLRGYRVDVRGAGGYVVGPGSVHPSGVVYEVTDDSAIAELPGWLVTLLRPNTPETPLRASLSHDRGSGGSTPWNVKSALVGLVGTVLAAEPGNRNAALHWAACRLAEHVREERIGEGAARVLMSRAGEQAGLDADEVRMTVASAFTVVRHG